MAIGVFGLQVAYKLKRTEVMSVDDTHGWFGGGLIPTPAVVSTVDRIDFSNDTGIVNTRGPLFTARYTLAATGNSNYGLYGGGVDPSATPTISSKVDRIDFSNDFPTTSPRSPLSLSRYGLAATGNLNYGWFGGGYTSVAPSISYSTVDRIDFSNDFVTASPRGPLSLARFGLAATGNSNYGWFGGGRPGPQSTVDRIDFSNDFVTASPRGLLSNYKYGMAATGNSNYGWFGGGYTTVVPVTAYSRVERIDFSNDSSTASVRGPLTAAKSYIAATGNSNYGWFGGGFPNTSTVERIDFSNDLTAASPRGLLSLGRNSLAATSGQAKGPAIKLQKAGNYGWFGGQFSTAIPGRITTVDRIDFSNDSVVLSPRGPLSSLRSNIAATGNSNYGWFGGGNPGSFGSSLVDRIDFSNDGATASVRGPLSAVRYSGGATGNSNYGWWCGGSIQPSPSLPPVHYSSTERINFSNDLATSSPKGVLSIAKTGLAATGNSNYGWFGGGFTNLPTPATFSTVERVNFSNDSTAILLRGVLNYASSSLAAAGNSNYGWFSGAPSPISMVTRIDFSNDSTTASVRGQLSLARSNVAATGNSNYGWWAGGSSGGAPFASYSRVDRVNFSNDLATASIRGSLASARYIRSATSNTTR